ncbi:acyltransferase [Botrimarina sp.]|uniref:acyltransferase n=1 Tax=Botrimarina sp. TaxID=2795802 RepID=UPI0032EF70C6
MQIRDDAPSSAGERVADWRGALWSQARHALPLWMCGLLSNWAPENKATCRLRGAAARPFIGRCGADFALGKDFQINTPERLEIGDSCYLARNVWLQAAGGVRLDDEVVVGPYAVIASLNHGFANGSTVGAGCHPAPIQIGRGTWLGARVTVTAGVTIGRGNLVAAGSVVTRDTPDDVVVAGVPARVIGPRVDNPSNFKRRSDILRRSA